MRIAITGHLLKVKMNNNLFEELSELEHNQWIAWSKNISETEEISTGRYERWKKLWRPYCELTEEEKNLDREWAGEVLEIVNKYIKMSKI